MEKRLCLCVYISVLGVFGRFFQYFLCVFYLFVVFFCIFAIEYAIILMVSKFFVLLIFNGDTNDV